MLQQMADGCDIVINIDLVVEIVVGSWWMLLFSIKFVDGNLFEGKKSFSSLSLSMCSSHNHIKLALQEFILE